MRFKLITLVFFFSCSFLFSQTETHTAPTLQVGLDGLDFSKGTLDSELILEIISEKQNEIKLRVAQNILLEPLNNCGATIYSFGDNILKAVIEEKDPLIRKRRILESTVNTLFTVAFANYYLKKIESDPKQFNAINELRSMIMGEINTEPDHNQTPIRTFPVPNKNIKKHSNLQKKINEIGKKIDSINRKVESKTNQNEEQREQSIINDNVEIDKLKKERNIYIEKINNIVVQDNGKTYNNEFIQLIYYTTILDIASESIRQNSTFKNLGVLNVSYSKTFDYQSNYLNPNYGKFEVFKLTPIENINKKFDQFTKIIFEGMKVELENLTQLIGVTKFLLDENNFRISREKILTKAFESVGDILNYDSIQTMLKSLSNENLTPIATIEINKIYNYIDKIKNKKDLTFKDSSDIIYTFNSGFIPAIENLGISTATTFNLIGMFRENSQIIFNNLRKNEELNNTLKFLANEDNLNFFTNLLSRLYEFDKGSTYIKYFNYISEISLFLEQDHIFKNSEVKEKLSYFNTFVKDYVVVNETEKGKDYIDFNVESFLNHLSEMKANQPNRFSFMFNVGASSGYFIRNPYEIDAATSLNNFSFVGEKIGLKIKFIDRKFWMSRSPGETYNIRGSGRIKTGVPKEPIISNYFWMLYGSGLVYNIFDLATENEFNSPFVGTGFGIEFFNNLDLSISGAVPIISNQSFSNSFQYPLLSLNFDIRFNEYLQRLGEKRKASQTQKALAKAQK
jgi:hypothetical protein